MTYTCSGVAFTITASLLLVLLLLYPHNTVHAFAHLSSARRSFLPSSSSYDMSLGNNKLPYQQRFATIPTDVVEQIINTQSASQPPVTMLGRSSISNATAIMGWECDDDALCVEVPACTDDVCRTSLDVRIHNQWYDLSGWRKAHPAGAHWIDWYDGRDATEVMDGFHSEKGRAMYQRLPASKPEVVAMLTSITPPDTTTQLNFRKLRQELESTGWWGRDMVHEYTQLGIWATLVVSAGIMAHSSIVWQPISCFLLALSMTAAGWLGHDYIHGVDKFAMKFRNFAALAAGLAPIWWSDKHNKVINECGGGGVFHPFHFLMYV
jgi:hypothetical protein